jgi:hypothetical protein
VKLFATPTHRNRTVVRVALLVGLFAGVTLAVRAVAPDLLDPLALRTFVLGFGSLAPVVFVLLQATQVVVAPVPGQLVGLVGGYLFGPIRGTAFSLLGVALGSTVVFVLSRRYGRPYVERMIVPETVAEFDEFVESAGLPGLFLVFLIPGLPDERVPRCGSSVRCRSSRSSAISPGIGSSPDCAGRERSEPREAYAPRPSFSSSRHASSAVDSTMPRRSISASTSSSRPGWAISISMRWRSWYSAR